MKRPIEVYLAIFLFGYYMTYPAKVLFASTQASTLAASITIGWIYVLLYSATTNTSFFNGISLRRIIILFALTAAALNITLTAKYHNSPLTLAFDANRYIIYLGACIPMILISKGGISKSSFIIKSTIIIAAIAYAISAILNSTYRLPTDLDEPINAKYFVGPLLRAGAGYLDPNFLAINMIILMIISGYFLYGKGTRFFITSACVIGVFMTFSRAAWLVTAILLLVPIINKKSVIKMGVVCMLGVFALTIGQSWISDEGLFRRFLDEEGASSTADRLRQYFGAINELQNMTIESALFGIGGPDAFWAKYGSHLHNFYLGAFISGGLLLVIIQIATLILIYYWTHGI
ncbi:hypothetical protein E6P97_03255, partial [Patescibacteria group bacterium]